MIFCDTYEDADKIFSKNTTEELKTLKCTPKLPRELKAKRSIIIKSCDKSIVEKSNEEIKTEIEKKNSFNVVEVFKFPNSNSIKVTLESQTKIRAVCQGGLYMFNFFIPPRVDKG